MVGIITAQDVIETVDDEMGDDYAKLAGLSSEEDLNETTKESMKKRLPWLIILLFLGMGVSAVVGAFEGVVAVLPVSVPPCVLQWSVCGFLPVRSAVRFWQFGSGSRWK